MQTFFLYCPHQQPSWFVLFLKIKVLLVGEQSFLVSWWKDRRLIWFSSTNTQTQSRFVGCQSFPLSPGGKASVNGRCAQLFQLLCCFTLLIQARLYASALFDLPDSQTCLQLQVQHWVVGWSSQCLTKWKVEMSGVLLFPNFDAHLYIIHISTVYEYFHFSLPVNYVLMALTCFMLNVWRL